MIGIVSLKCACSLLNILFDSHTSSRVAITMLDKRGDWVSDGAYKTSDGVFLYRITRRINSRSSGTSRKTWNRRNQGNSTVVSDKTLRVVFSSNQLYRTRAGENVVCSAGWIDVSFGLGVAYMCAWNYFTACSFAWLFVSRWAASCRKKLIWCNQIDTDEQTSVYAVVYRIHRPRNSHFARTIFLFSRHVQLVQKYLCSRIVYFGKFTPIISVGN